MLWYGQAIRMKRICPNDVDLLRALMELESWLTDQTTRNSDSKLIDRNCLLKKTSKASGG